MKIGVPDKRARFYFGLFFVPPLTPPTLGGGGFCLLFVLGKRKVVFQVMGK